MGIIRKNSAKHRSDEEFSRRNSSVKSKNFVSRGRKKRPLGKKRGTRRRKIGKAETAVKKTDQQDQSPQKIFESGWNWQASHPGIAQQMEPLRLQLVKKEYTWSQLLKKTLSHNAMPQVHHERFLANAQSSGSEYNHNATNHKDAPLPVSSRKKRPRRSTFFLNKSKEIDLGQLEKHFYDILRDPEELRKKDFGEMVIEEKEHVKWDEVDRCYFDDRKIDSIEMEGLGKEVFKKLYCEYLLFNQDNQKVFPGLFEKAAVNAMKSKSMFSFN